MLKTVLIDAPEEEPISLEELKAHLRVTGTSQDGYLNSLRSTIRTAVERYLKRALMTQTYKAYADYWETCFKMSYPPLQSVTYVKYYDTDGVLQTLDMASYWVVNTTDPGYIQQAYDVTYPELQLGRPDAIEVEFVAGYGDAADVPAPIKHAMKIWATDLYEHRGEVVIGSGVVARIPDHVKNLLHDYRIYKF